MYIAQSVAMKETYTKTCVIFLKPLDMKTIVDIFAGILKLLVFYLECRVDSLNILVFCAFGTVGILNMTT